MTTPLDGLCEFADELDAQDALALDVKAFFKQPRSMYHHFGQCLEAMAVLSQRHGMTALLAQVPAERAQQLTSFLANARQVWGAFSQAYPFPEFPDDPVPPPVVELPAEGGM
jgi:hypothetical protein